MDIDYIYKAQIFNHGNDGVTIEIIYYTGNEKGFRASSGYDSMLTLRRGHTEQINDFIDRVKETAWENYLKPSEKTIGNS